MENMATRQLKEATEGSTVTMLKDGIQQQVIVTHVSKCQINVRFFYTQNGNRMQGVRMFTTKGDVKYLPDERGKTKLLSLDVIEPVF